MNHTNTGNCWDNAYSCPGYKEGLCIEGELCDVCHDHDAPRGDCSQCPKCEKCALPSKGETQPKLRQWDLNH